MQDHSTTRYINQRQKRFCGVPECGGGHSGNGLCGKHNTRWRRSGSPPVFMGYTIPLKPTSCAIEGCTAKIRSVGLCQKHYNNAFKVERPRKVMPNSDRRPGQSWADGRVEAVCIKCKVLQPIDKFPRMRWETVSGEARQSRSRACKACRNTQHAKKYRPFKPKHCKRCSSKLSDETKKRYCRRCYKKIRQRSSSSSGRQLAAKIREWKKLAIAQRGGRCQRCQIAYEIQAVYDFHHRNPVEKTLGVAWCKTWEEYWREVEKCDLLCSNCHRITHWEWKQKSKIKPLIKNVLQPSLLADY